MKLDSHLLNSFSVDLEILEKYFPKPLKLITQCVSFESLQDIYPHGNMG